MDFHTFVRILRARWVVVVAAIVACLAGAFAITMVQTKTYQASATILVSFDGAVTVNDVFEATQASQRRLSSYAEIAGGRTVAQRAIAELGVPLSPNRLVENTDVTYTPESTVFRLTVADSDPQRAAALATAMAGQFAALVPEVDARSQADQATPELATSTDGPPQAQLVSAKATVVEQPEVPQRAVSPVPARNAALGLVAGVLLGVALALARNGTDRTIRNLEILTAHTDLPTIAQLPRPGKHTARRNGGRTKPSELAYDEAVRRLRSGLLGPTTAPARSVLVTAAKVGQGVTTSALHLALAFAELDETVLLVEGDPRQPAIADLVGADPDHGLADVLADEVMLDDAVWATSRDGLWVLASTRPAGFHRPVSTQMLGTMLEKLRAGFDRVVIDGPPALVTADAGIIAAAVDATVLVVRAGRTTVDEVDTALDNLRTAGGNVVGTALTAAPLPRYTRAATSAYRAKVAGSTSAALRVSAS